MRPSPQILLPLSLLLLAPLQPAAAQTYTVTDLGTLPGGTYSYANAINNKGHITGTADTDRIESEEDRRRDLLSRHPYVLRADHAFFWNDGKISDIGYPNGLQTGGYAINDKDQIVGASMDTCGFTVGRWLTAAKQPEQDGYGCAYGINNKGQYVGEEHQFDLMTGRHPFATGQVLDSLKPDANIADRPTEDAEATGINDAGLVVGSADVSAKPGTKPRHAVLWRKGVRQDLGTLGGTESRAQAVNGTGQIVGVSSVTQAAADGNPLYHAFFWDTGKMTDLGTLAGDKQSGANALNARGEVVGYSGERACLWRGGKAYDLNALLPAGSGWVLQSAAGINNRGQIVGTGLHGGKKRGYLLTPKL